MVISDKNSEELYKIICTRPVPMEERVRVEFGTEGRLICGDGTG